MKEDFDFQKIGKRMPYEVPEGFLDHISGKILSDYQQSEAKKKKIFPLKVWISVAASLVIVVSGSYFYYHRLNGINTHIAQNISKKKSEPVMQGKSVQLNQQQNISINQNADTVGQKRVRPNNLADVAQPATQIVMKAETLDEALQNISDDELAQLANLAENDVVYEE